MSERTLFSAEHEMFRESVRRFMERELAPHHEEWEEKGEVPRWAWKKAGEQGFLCVAIPEEWGGVGADRRYSIILMEEQARLNLTGTRLRTAFRYRGALYRPLRHPRAEACLAAQDGVRRCHCGDCHDRAGRRLGPAGDPHHRHQGWRRIRDFRPEDLHHQRPDRRPFLVACKTDRSEGAAASAS